MLNKSKIREMSQAAIYEKHEGRDDMKINHYTGGDYVRYNLLKTLLGVTVAFILITGLYILYSSEDLFQIITNLNLEILGKLLLLLYLLTIAVYVLVSVVFYQYKYSSAQKRLKKYNKSLEVIGRYSKETEDELDVGGKDRVN